MVDALLGIVAPHPCYKCGKTGGILCTNCKYDITSEIPNTCLLCGKPAPSDGICRDEKTAYTKAWHVDDRIETIKHVIDAFKFEHTYEAHQTLADLLAEALGNLPTTVTVVPLPTISAHRRQRGYDHILLLARALAKRKQLTLTPVIKRQTNTVQRDASRAQRLKQARQAFVVNSRLPGGIYLLVDDVVTTGASLEYGARALLAAGADEVWVAVVARQPLD